MIKHGALTTDVLFESVQKRWGCGTNAAGVMGRVSLYC